MLLEEVKVIGDGIVVECVVTEVENALYSTCRCMVNHPFKVLKLQVSYAHMAYYALVAEFNKCRQGLIDHLLQSARQICLEFDVVNVDQVNKLNAQSLHAFIDTVCDTTSRIVPCIHAILSISSHLRAQEVHVRIPNAAFVYLGMEEKANTNATDLLTGDKMKVDFVPEGETVISLDAWKGAVLKIR